MCAFRRPPFSGVFVRRSNCGNLGVDDRLDEWRHAGHGVPRKVALAWEGSLERAGIQVGVIAQPRRVRYDVEHQLLALAVMLAAMFAVTGYLLGIGSLNSVGRFIPMALPTALALLAGSSPASATRRPTASTRYSGSSGWRSCSRGPSDGGS